MRTSLPIVLAALLVAAWCAPLSQVQAAPAETDDSNSVITTGNIDVKGGSLFFKTRGNGDPIVVLHGGPGFDHRQFLPFIWELAKDHQVILYDQRGTGLSTGKVDSTSINVAGFVDDLEAIRRHFKIERMNILGHSWGGILAMHYALDHPDRLRSLILCSTTASVDAFGEMRTNYMERWSESDQLALGEIGGSEAFKQGDPASWERFWRTWFRSYFRDPAQADRMDLFFPPNTIKNCGPVANLIMASIGEFDLHEELASITCPTLIMHGMADPMPAAYAERTHGAIPGSELVLAPEVGHWFFVDGTEIFAESILGFLERVEP